MTPGTAVFTMPSGSIKCAGAPQNIAYLAADHWLRRGVLNNIHIVLISPTPALFGVPELSKVLEEVVKRYHVDVHLQSEMIEVDGDKRELVIKDNQEDSTLTLRFDLLHAVPPQSAPGWVKRSPISDMTPNGYIEVGKTSHRHPIYHNIFALGNAGNTPNSKTGAAIRKQAPVVVANLLAEMRGEVLSAEYDGYASCPLVTAHNRMLLAEFDYTMKPHPSIPIINTQRERYDMWLLKRYGIPFIYWNLMLKGRA
ncbi:MAG: NAD(P)/FAD-dependent oxidoreductase [Ferrimicrobium acidiphilum]